MISTAVMNYLMEIAVASVIFPVVLLCIWRLRTRKNMLPALAGALMFLCFAKLLEMIPYSIFVGFTNPVSRIVRSNEILYALYLGTVAALFEETGRFLAFRYFLPKYGENRETSVTYGIGHGGVECILMLGWTNLQYYIAATVLTTVSNAAEELPKEMIDEITSLTLFDCVLDGISALLFFILQIGLSVFVFQAYRNDVLRKRLIAFAMLFHLIAYLPNGAYQAQVIPHLLSVILLFITVSLVSYVAWVIYKKMGESEKMQEKEKRNASAGNGFDIAKQRLSNIEEQKGDERGH